MATHTKIAPLILVFGSFIQTTWAAEDLMTSQLVDQARHWQQKNRDDISAEIWRSLLRADPEHGEALVKLGLIEARAGNRRDAQLLFERAKRVRPEPRGLHELTAMLEAEPIARANPIQPPLKQISSKTEKRAKTGNSKNPPTTKAGGPTDPDALLLKP